VRAPRSAPGRDREGAPLVAIVNQTTAHGFWGSEEAALGKHVVVNARRTTIVGVVGDIYQAGARGEVPPGIYQPDAQFPRPSTTLVVKAGTRAAALTEAITGQMQRTAPGLAVRRVHQLEDLWSETLADSRFSTLVLSVFTLVAVILASACTASCATRSSNAGRSWESGRRSAPRASTSSRSS
jgi:hypothetical protein